MLPLRQQFYTGNLGQAKRVAAFVNSAHLDVGSTPRGPGLALKAPTLAEHGVAMMRGPRSAIAFVAETLRDAI